MKLTVIICTADRHTILARVFASIAAAAPPVRAGWEVLVVNNGSRDGTEAVVEAFTDRLPVRCVFEPMRGISHARNAGMAAAAGDYLLWTDDDATVETGWLRAYESGFERHPTGAFFGGPIRPHLTGTPPDWLTSGLSTVSGAYASLSLASHEQTIDPGVHELPYGANMATRRDVQRRYPFDPRFGRQDGRELLHGEESDVLRRMLRGGASGVWLPDAVVNHWIGPARQTVGYLRRYYRASGATRGLRDRQDGWEPGFGDVLRMRTEAAAFQGIYLLGRSLALPDLWLPALVRSERVRGRLDAHRSNRRTALGAEIT